MRDDLAEDVQAAHGIDGQYAGDIYSQEGDDEDHDVALYNEQGVSNNAGADNNMGRMNTE